MWGRPSRAPNQDRVPGLQVSQRVESGRARAVATATAEQIATYWAVGGNILERQREQGCGARVIDRLSADLQQRFPDARGFSPRNLK